MIPFYLYIVTATFGPSKSSADELNTYENIQARVEACEQITKQKYFFRHIKIVAFISLSIFCITVSFFHAAAQKNQMPRPHI